jgi:hypothetical protein
VGIFLASYIVFRVSFKREDTNLIGETLSLKYFSDMLQPNNWSFGEKELREWYNYYNEPICKQGVL